MNPYQPPYSNVSDVVIVSVLVVLWLTVAGGVFRLRDSLKQRPSFGNASAAARGFLSLCFVIAATFIVGMVFLALFQIRSPLWAAYEVLFAMSVIAVFYVLPIVCIVVVGWAWVHRRHDSDSPLFYDIACPLALAMDAAIYFAFHFALIARPS
jgi:hypothetical protein